MRKCTCTPPLTFVKCQTNKSLTTHLISAQSVRPFPRFRKAVRTCSLLANSVKRLANGSLTTYEISAQSVQPFTRYEKEAHRHVRTCKWTSLMACALYIATWSLNTHQIWSQSTKPFLSYSLAVNFYTPHFARASYHTGYPDGWMLVPFTGEGMQLPIKEDRLSIGPVVAEI